MTAFLDRKLAETGPSALTLSMGANMMTSVLLDEFPAINAFSKKNTKQGG